MKIVCLLAIWAVALAIQSVFRAHGTSDDDDDGDDSSKGLSFQRDGVTVLSIVICNGLSFFLDCVTILLVSNDSVGHNAFQRLWYVSSFWSALAVTALICTFVFDRGVATTYWAYENIAICQLVINSMVLLFAFCGLYYILTRFKIPDERAGVYYMKYTIGFYLCYVFFQSFTFTGNFVTVNLGICGGDICLFVRYLTFAPVVYRVLKRDCQYWGTDVDEEEEITMKAAVDDLGWAEGNSYTDVVIPKTAIYFKKKLQEQVNTTVEVHLWRRRQVVMKRFRFDLLTRENINCFKQEASIYRKLNHPNIVNFYGIVVDPPSLGIVMEYAVNGDLFVFLHKKYVELRQNISKDGSRTISRLGSESSAFDVTFCPQVSGVVGSLCQLLFIT